jgi:hypothetical protein
LERYNVDGAILKQIQKQMVKHVSGESDFDTFVSKNIKNQSEKKQRVNKMTIFKEYLNEKPLGKGNFGKVYKVK